MHVSGITLQQTLVMCLSFYIYDITLQKQFLFHVSDSAEALDLNLLQIILLSVKSLILSLFHHWLIIKLKPVFRLLINSKMKEVYWLLIITLYSDNNDFTLYKDR